MVNKLVVSVALLWVTSTFALATDRPTIGIVSHELCGAYKSRFPFYDAFIPASYVKAVESSGARVVPIIIGQSEEYYRKIFNSINGILIPGGATYLNGTNNYYSAGKLLYELAIEANQRVSFPVLGVCLGFELLLHVANQEKEIRKHCELKDVNLALKFEPKFKKSSLFRHATKRVIHTLQTNVTVNYHQWCIYPKDFKNEHLESDWKILSTSLDPNPSQPQFISSVEHKKYPLAGIQFHPGKHSFEWSAKRNYPHTPQSIEAGRHFFDWLVDQARLNNHSFATEKEEVSSLIYNYRPVYSDQYNISYTQMYLFKTRWTNQKSHAQS